MSADVLGKSVLQDVYTESLAELLLTLRNLQSPQRRYSTGIEILDKIVEHYQTSSSVNDNRTASRSAQRHQGDTLHSVLVSNAPYDDEHPNFDFEILQATAPSKPILINISLGKPGSRPAATYLLNHLTSISTLPYTKGGKQGCVVWIDLSNTFNAKLLYQHVLHHLTCKRLTAEQEPDSHRDSIIHNEDKTADDVEGHAGQILQHVHVIRCTSTRQLLETLQNLPANYLFNLTENQSIDRACTLLAIDSVNQFHWIDQFDAEIARLQGPSQLTPRETTHASSNNVNIISRILNELNSFSSRFECPVVYTSHPIHTLNSTTQNTTSTVTIASGNSTRIDPFHTVALMTLSPASTAINVPQFAAVMNIEDCVRDQEKRLKALKESYARWWVDVKTSSGAGAGAAGRNAGPLSAGSNREKTGFWMRIDCVSNNTSSDGIGIKIE